LCHPGSPAAGNPRVSWQPKAAVLLAGLWVLSPIDLLPEFRP